MQSRSKVAYPVRRAFSAAVVLSSLAPLPHEPKRPHQLARPHRHL